MKLTKGGFDIIRKAFGKLSESQVSAFNHIVSTMDADKSISYPQGAYILATIWHETATTMQPIAVRRQSIALRWYRRRWNLRRAPVSALEFCTRRGF